MSHCFNMIDMIVRANLLTGPMVLLSPDTMGLVVRRQPHIAQRVGTGEGLCLYIQGAC